MLYSQYNNAIKHADCTRVLNQLLWVEIVYDPGPYVMWMGRLPGLFAPEPVRSPEPPLLGSLSEFLTGIPETQLAIL